MGFFDNIGKGISDFSQATIQKGKDVASITKYNRMIADEEKAISKLYEAAGKLYVEMHAEDPGEGFAEIVGQIQQSREKIAEYTEAIKELQGITQCARCGSDVPNGAVFCPECGAKCTKEETEEPQDEGSEKPKKLYCTNCGAVVAPEFKFCAACGAKVEPVCPEPDPQEEPQEPEGIHLSLDPSEEQELKAGQ